MLLKKRRKIGRNNLGETKDWREGVGNIYNKDTLHICINLNKKFFILCFYQYMILLYMIYNI